MPKFVKKAILVLTSSVFLLVSLLTVPAARAQSSTSADDAPAGTWYNQSFNDWSTKVFSSPGNEIFGERYTFAQVQWIVYSLAAILTGTDIIECAKLAEDPTKLKDCVDKLGPVEEGGEEGFRGIDGALMGAGFAADSLLSLKPASGVEYLANTAARFHLIPEAYAQGFGFTSIAPVQKLWMAFRNMAYALLVVVVLAMAFMIMFRVKISPQVVISIQSALPKLVGILILITFSYAIAGLLIDLSYLIIAIFVAFAKAQGLIGNLTPPIDALTIAQRVWGTAAWPIASLLFLVTLPLILIALGLVVVAVAGVFTAGVGTLVAAVGWLLIAIIVIFIFIQFLKTLWAMLKAFINVLLLIIFGPLLIMFGGFSPTIGGFGMWFKSLAANVAVFPTIALMGFIAHLLYWSFPHSIMGLLREGSWVNPFEISQSVEEGIEFSLPLFEPGGFLAPVLAGLAIILIMPSAAELIKSVISGQPFNFGQAIGQATTPLKYGVGPAKFAAGEAGQWLEDKTKPTRLTRALKTIAGLRV